MNANEFLHAADNEVENIDDEDLRSAAGAIVASNKAVVAAVDELRALIDRRVTTVVSSAGAERIDSGSRSAQRVNASCTMSSASAALPSMR